MKRDIARELFRSYRSGLRKKKDIVQEERTELGDPQNIGAILNELVSARDWRQGIAEGNLFSDWREIVGADIAEHSTPITLYEGKLTIQTSSTAWSTQLRLMQGDLLKTIRQSAPGALVEELAIIGPHAPSWKRGLRTIRGARGPRDTFG
ncbi:MAG TPA: DciA family protein [Candidatus Nanopelagicaceae bacterium]|jgi:predicted nucleic acid-binding Zn ribbon protein|nr:DciA family protein [Candidatus Nanopelagicaceae bacterium]